MLALTLGGVEAKPALLHPDRRNDAKTMAAPLFITSEFVIGDDLHPAVAGQFAQGALGWTSGRRVPAIALSQQGLNLLNGRLALPPGDPRTVPGYTAIFGLALDVGPPGEPQAGVLRVSGVEVLHFASGVGLALVTLEWGGKQPLTLDALQLLLSRLTPNREKDVLRWAHLAAPPEDQRFSLGWLLGQVLVSATCRFEVWSRFFTYVYATLPAGTDPDAMSDAAWRLSRHYSPGYGAEPSFPGTELYAPFADIRHALSLEGAATVANQASDFVANGGLAGRFGNCYLPLAILAYHEHAYLLDIAQEAARVPPGDDAGAQVEALRHMTDRFLRFRLRYRLALVSDITMHNAFYERMRRSLQLEVLEAKLGQDVAEAQSHLRRVADEAAAAAATAAAEASRAQANRDAKAAHEQEEAYRKRERSRAPMLGLFAGLLTYLTSSAAFKDVEKLMPDHLKPNGIWFYGFAALLALLAFWLTFSRQRDENRPNASGHGQHGGHTAHHLDEERRQEGGITASKALIASAAASSRGTEHLSAPASPHGPVPPGA
jgi:hypothetical protein